MFEEVEVFARQIFNEDSEITIKPEFVRAERSFSQEV